MEDPEHQNCNGRLKARCRNMRRTIRRRFGDRIGRWRQRRHLATCFLRRSERRNRCSTLGARWQGFCSACCWGRCRESCAAPHTCRQVRIDKDEYPSFGRVRGLPPLTDGAMGAMRRIDGQKIRPVFLTNRLLRNCLKWPCLRCRTQNILTSDRPCNISQSIAL